MEKRNVIVDKSYQFGLRTIKLYIHLGKLRVERELLIQFLKCGTSVGANVEEAMGAQSTRDFISKLNISYKESREARYWLMLFKDAGLLDIKLADSFIADVDELRKILSSILKTSKEKNAV